MILLILSTFALAETFHIDAKIPAALYIDGQAIVEFSHPGRGEFEVTGGEHKLLILTNGNPTERVVNFTDKPTLLVIGRTGISLGEAKALPTSAKQAGVDSPVELRSTSRMPLSVTIDSERYILAPGETKAISLKAGEHAIKVKNDVGTAIFANGTLVVHGTNEVIIQLSEGRIPEIAGAGAEFLSRAND